MSDKENPQHVRPTIYPFNPKDLGRSLREVAVEVIQDDGSDIESRWYHGKKDVDLYFWRDQKKNIIKQQVTFYGQLVEWNVMEGMRTGLLIEDETSQKMAGSPLIRYDVEPQRHAIEQGVAIVSHIPGLSDGEKLQIIENFVKGPTFGELTPEDIMSRYGRPKTAPQSTSLFKRFLNFLGGLFKKK